MHSKGPRLTPAYPLSIPSEFLRLSLSAINIHPDTLITRSPSRISEFTHYCCKNRRQICALLIFYDPDVSVNTQNTFEWKKINPIADIRRMVFTRGTLIAPRLLRAERISPLFGIGDPSVHPFFVIGVPPYLKYSSCLNIKSSFLSAAVQTGTRRDLIGTVPSMGRSGV